MDKKAPKVITPQGYEQDAEYLKNGVAINFGKNKDGTKRIAILKPINSSAYEDRLTALNKADGRMVHRDKDIERENQIQAMAEKSFIGIVQGKVEGDDIESAWYDGDGGKIEDTVENRMALLRDRNFFIDVLNAVAERETFKRLEFEADLGNSPKSLTGS